MWKKIGNTLKALGIVILGTATIVITIATFLFASLHWVGKKTLEIGDKKG